MITYHPSSSDFELHQILELQQSNLPASISEEEQITEGFVTVHHDFATLKAMHEKCPHTLAKEGENVIGYALSMHPDFGSRIEILKPMFKQLHKYFDTIKMLPQQFQDEKYIVMGQVCIDKAYRKQGIFRKLYEHMQKLIAPEFSSIITEVDGKNKRSLAAHQAIGFTELKRYTAGRQEWVLVYLKSNLS